MAWRAATRCAGRLRSSERHGSPVAVKTGLFGSCAKCPSSPAISMFPRAARHMHPRGGLLRHHLAAPDIDAVGFKRAIRLFDRTYNRDMGAGFQLALIACLISEDTGIRRHDDFLLPVLVFNNHHAP